MKKGENLGKITQKLLKNQSRPESSLDADQSSLDQSKPSLGCPRILNWPELEPKRMISGVPLAVKAEIGKPD